MRSVNIAELKDRLSTYVKYARAGETVIIRDRNTAVARLAPIEPDDGLTDEERSLVVDGIMSMPSEALDLQRIRNLPNSLKGNAAIQALIDDRNEGW